MKVRVEEEGFEFAFHSDADTFVLSAKGKRSAEFTQSLFGVASRFTSGYGQVLSSALSGIVERAGIKPPPLEIHTNHDGVFTDHNGEIIVPEGLGANEALEGTLWQLIGRQHSKEDLAGAIQLCARVLESLTATPSDLDTPASAPAP